MRRTVREPFFHIPLQMDSGFQPTLPLYFLHPNHESTPVPSMQKAATHCGAACKSV